MSVLVMTSLADALAALSARPSTLVVAGGTDVMVELNDGRRSADAVLSVSRVAELRSWLHDPVASTVRIGAALTYSELMHEPLASLMPALAQAARTVGSPQIRNAATIGGNVATASPAGDGLPVLAALGAIVHLASVRGERDVEFGEFMTGPKRTVREPDELIVAVTVPVVEGFQGYAKVGVRNAMVIATASMCLVADRRARTVRIAMGSVGPVILRAGEAERLAASAADFEHGRIDDEAVRAVAAAAAAEARPIDDHRSTAAYRRRAIEVLAGRLTRRAFPNG